MGLSTTRLEESALNGVDYYRQRVDELEAENQELVSEIVDLDAENTELKERIELLRAQLRKPYWSK